MENNSGDDKDSSNGSESSKSDEDAESDDDSINLNDSKDAPPASPKKAYFLLMAKTQRT